jgi:hypothetical protein
LHLVLTSLHDLRKIVGHHLLGFLQEITLHEVDAAAEQDRHAGRVLDELGDRELARMVGLIAQFPELLLVFLVLGQLRHEAAIELEVVRVDVLEQLHRVQPGAELFQRKAAVDLLEPRDEGARRLEVRDDLAGAHS